VLVRQSIALSGADGIALTKLDVLDGFDEVKICTGYKLNGKVLINSVGTVVGSHTGPGTVALFFWGDSRKKS